MYICTCICERKSRISVVEYPKLVEFSLKNVQNWDQSWQAVGITFKEAMRVAHKVFFSINHRSLSDELLVHQYLSSIFTKTWLKQGSSAGKFISLRILSGKQGISHQWFWWPYLVFCREFQRNLILSHVWLFFSFTFSIKSKNSKFKANQNYQLAKRRCAFLEDLTFLYYQGDVQVENCQIVPNSLVDKIVRACRGLVSKALIPWFWNTNPERF